MPPLPKTTHAPEGAGVPRAPIDVAKSFVVAGVPVFPCREAFQEGIDEATGEPTSWNEKAPYTAKGLHDATVRDRIIEAWFGRKHPKALIGVPTGEKLGAWVLDLDRHGERDGHVWLAEMEAKHGPLPETARALTANGGTHIFFSYVEGVRNRAAIAPGVDTRGSGGYIIAPGSVMDDGRFYDWDGHDGHGLPEFADAPQWLLDLVVRKPEPAVRVDYHYKPGRHEAYVEKALQSELEQVARTGVGSRGSQLNTSAFVIGTLVGAGALSRSEAEAGLLDAARACGVAAKDGERATLDRIRRGLNDGEKRPRHLPEREHENDNEVTDRDRASIGSLVSKSRQTSEPAQEAVDPPKRERFEKTWFDEIEEGAPKETFVKGVFGKGEFTTVSGLPGTGKSVIVTDIACHVAAGLPWHGRKVEQGLVVYVAAERKKLTERRMMAFRKRHGIKDVPLLVIGGRLDFTKDDRDARELASAIREAETETGLTCVWVIIDTLTRVFGAGDQNASKDMTRFVNSCDTIIAETKAHLTAIHHSAWSGERGKGAIDLDGAIDASFMVKKVNSQYQLVCDGTNDGEEGVVLSFMMDSVQVGVDEDGEPTTAPVVVKVADVTPLKAAAARKEARQIEILRTMAETNGEASDGLSGFPEGVLLVKTDDWRLRCYAADGDLPQGTLQQRFSRARKRALREGLIEELGQWVWLSDR